MEWTITEDDKKLSQIPEKALVEGPQRLLRDHEAVVVLSEDDYRRLKWERAMKENDFLEFLRSGPGFEGVDISRDQSPSRDIVW